MKSVRYEVVPSVPQTIIVTAQDGKKYELSYRVVITDVRQSPNEIITPAGTVPELQWDYQIHTTIRPLDASEPALTVHTPGSSKSN